MEQILAELNLQNFYPILRAENINLALLATICIVWGDKQQPQSVRIQPSLQNILIQKCGLNKSQLIQIVTLMHKKGHGNKIISPSQPQITNRRGALLGVIQEQK